MSDRENAQTVSSKYFSTGCVMDESLTDFQEPKKLAGQKTAAKKKSDKPKKAPKRIRGQKDIRTALRSQKNELESYSKDFDNVCRQAGLDVDPEQLQIAIALSKSLQQSDSNSPEISQSQTPQDRVGKIRTTLLEYGFKVPEIKIKKASKRLKKRKQYKLLITSEETKRHIIADKYSQVLFQNINLTNYSQVTDTDLTHIWLYNLATNATYEILKSMDTFYVDNLLEKSTSTGNLLRDWSEIPGRPISPKPFEPNTMNFSEIECSQGELDIVLSGTLKSCRNIIKDKEASVSIRKSSDKKLVTTNNLDNSVIVLLDDENVQSNESETVEVKDIEIMKECKVNMALDINHDINLENPIATVKQYRSDSPDLFDDDPSTVDDANMSSQENEPTLHNFHSINSPNGVVNVELDLSKSVKEKHLLFADIRSLKSQNTSATRGFNDCMEITECVDVHCVNMETRKVKSPLQLSQNVTKRKSNDFMEITNCVVRPLLPIEVDIDLTQSPENENHATNIIPTNINVNIINSMASKYDETPKTENQIDLTESPETFENVVDKSIASLDLTQSSNASDELPFVSLKVSTKDQSMDNTIIIDPKDYEGMNDSAIVNDNYVLDLTQNLTRHEVSQELHNNDDHTTNIVQNPEEILDLTQEVTETSRQNSKNNEANASFFGDYVNNHSDNKGRNSSCDDNYYEEPKPNDKEESATDNVYVDVGKDIQSTEIMKSASKSNNSIDLTQHSESSEDLSQHLQKEYQIETKTGNNVNTSIEIDKGSQSDMHLTQSSLSRELPDDRGKDIECCDSDDIEMEIIKSSKRCSSLGKKVNVSIDYDEMYDNLLSQYSQSRESRTSKATADNNTSNMHLTQSSLSRELPDDRGKDVESCDSDDIEMEIIKSSQRCSSLGKKDNVSIDYDEMYDNLLSQYSQSRESRTSKATADNNTSNVSNKDVSNCSQNSEVFVISDNELDYSMYQSKLDKPVDNFLFGGISIMDELSGLASFRRSTKIESSVANEDLYTDNLLQDNEKDNTKKTPVKHKRVNELATPQKPGCSGINTVETPNNEYVIKTLDVTPRPKYGAMSLEELHNELDKFGVKPFKRKRAIQLLTHIYNQTHPTVEPCSDEESPCKRRKTNNYDSPRKQSPTKLTPRMILSPKQTAKSPRKNAESKKSPKKPAKKRKENTKDRVKDTKENISYDIEMININSNYEVNETPVIKEAECNAVDWVFQKREKAKVYSCRVPLHIAFHNYVLSRPGLREAILCYEPINIDNVYKDLVGYGHRYDPKDLLKYMDKKCITVKTTDNDARNQKR